MTALRRPAPLAAGVVTTLASAPALAQDLPDVGKLVGFVSWGGLALSFVAVAVAIVVLRVVSGSSERLGQRFANRRLQIQKLESILRFLVYTVTALACVLLTFRLDATALTVLGGTIAFTGDVGRQYVAKAYEVGWNAIIAQSPQHGPKLKELLSK